MNEYGGDDDFSWVLLEGSGGEGGAGEGGGGEGGAGEGGAGEGGAGKGGDEGGAGGEVGAAARWWGRRRWRVRGALTTQHVSIYNVPVHVHWCAISCVV